VFSIHKVQRTGISDFLSIIYALLCGSISYLWMEKPLSDMLQWFAENPQFVLSGWGFWDYVKAFIFISSCFGFVFGVLLYDRSSVTKDGEDRKGLIEKLISIPVSVAMLYAFFYLMGLFISNVPYRILFLAVFLAFFQKSDSGSAVARTFLVQLPGVYIIICSLQALGFWMSLAFFAVMVLIETPTKIFTRMKT